MKEPERRRWPRRELGAVVDIMEEIGVRLGRAVGVNISRGGMLLQTLLDYREGERLTVSFLLPGSADQLVVHGRVVRVVSPEEAGPEAAGVAIEFVPDNPGWVMAEVVRFVEGQDRLPEAVLRSKE